MFFVLDGRIKERSCMYLVIDLLMVFWRLIGEEVFFSVFVVWITERFLILIFSCRFGRSVYVLFYCFTFQFWVVRIIFISSMLEMALLIVWLIRLIIFSNKL